MKGRGVTPTTPKAGGEALSKKRTLLVVKNALSQLHYVGSKYDGRGGKKGRHSGSE